MSSDNKEVKQAKACPSELAVKYVSAFAESDKCPAQIKPYLSKAAPHIGTLIKFLMIAGKYLEIAYNKGLEYYEIIRPYQPELLLPAFIGFVMCFFGGNFLTLIAAVEAFKMCGYESTMECVHQLLEDLKKVKEANEKDDSTDLDGDGTPDVLQMKNEELVKRKMLLFLRVLDPHRLTVAITGITSGFLAVIASLKVQFAKTITLGNAIGEALEPPAISYLLPLIEFAIPPEYKKWGKPLVQYSIRSIAVSIAWTVQRVISAFHSAIRGGMMFSRSILEYLSKRNIVHINHEETYLDEVVGYALAALGFWFQLSTAFTLPFPLNLLLLPFTIMEYVLIYCVNAIN